MRRGTRVGQAYVALSVDGDGINDEIADEIEDVGWEKIGRNASGQYAKGWKDIRGEIKDTLSDSESDFDASMKRISAAIQNDNAIGQGIAKQLASAFDDGRLDVLIKQVGRESGADFGGEFGAQFDRILKSSVLNSVQEAMEDAARKGTTFQLAATRGDSKVDLPTADYEKILANAQAEFKKFNAEVIKDDAKLWDQRRKTAEAYIKYRAQLERKQIDEFGNQVSRNQGKGFDVGRFFGAGSRNNALNLLGRSIGNVTDIVNKFFKAGAAVPGLLAKFGEGFSAAAEGASFFQKVGAGFGSQGLNLGKAFSSIAASGPAAAAALVAVGAALTVIVSVANALLAVLAALAATIASALVGAMAVASAGLVALVAAGGLAIAMFSQLSNAQKKVLGTSFKPVVETFRGLGQELAKPIFAGNPSPVEVWAENVRKGLQLLGPVARVMGDAFARSGKIITGALSGKGFQNFADALSKNLPGITVNLSKAFGSFLNGALGLFAVLMPYVERFSVYLADLADRFARFTNSPEGQNKIVDFVDRALVSLTALKDFVGAVGGLISAVLFSPEGQEAGNSIFDDMTRGIQNFTAYLQEDNRLEKWFEEGKNMAKALGDVIRTVALVLSTLNSSGVLAGIRNVAEFGLKAAEAFRNAPGPIKAMILPITQVSNAFKLLAAVAVGGLALIVNAFASMLRAAATAVGKLADIPIIGRKFKGLENGVRAAADNVTDLGNRMSAIPKNLVFSVLADTSPAQNSVVSFLNQAKKIRLTIPMFAIGPGAAGFKPPKAPAPSVSIPKFTIPQIGGAGFGDSDGGSKAAAAKAGKSAAEIRKALRGIYNDILDGLTSIRKATSGTEVQQQLNSMLKAMNQAADGLGKVARRKIAATSAILKRQKVIDSRDVDALVRGEKVRNATLAEIAAARGRVAVKLDLAKQKLAEAISLRDEFRRAVADSVRTFGALTTAQAQSINGVEQALTANDITTNLEQRLAKIKAFQDNLRVLLASGLSNAAYKQILDAGVEEGGAYAAALVAGGTGAVQQVNGLVSQIEGAANQLGLTASTRMYQAGVDAAQGLVDGLNSLSAQLNSAAVKLGQTIATAVKNSLGIKSPSTVMIAAMGYVGDGLEQGLDAQQARVGAASNRLANQIAVSPEVAAYASRNGSAAVSGNSDQRPIELTVVTPTKDPKAVAIEAVNELTGRL